MPIRSPGRRASASITASRTSWRALLPQSPHDMDMFEWDYLLVTEGQAMEHDHGSMDALRADLAELTALHGPSGSEQPVIARLRDRFAPLCDGVAVDHMGNLVATLEGPPGAPHVVVSAHA